MTATGFRSEVGAPEPSNVMSVDGVAVAYRDSGGDGPVLICLHAIGHGAADFKDLTQRFAAHYRVIAPDFPGHGKSGPDAKPACGIRYTEILTGFVDKLSVNSVILLGNSIGGAVVIRYTAANPDRVSGIVLCNSGGLDPGGSLARAFTKMFALFFAAGRRRAFWFPWAFDRYYRKVLSREPARERRERIVRSAYEVAPVLEQAWESFSRPEEDVRGLLQAIRCPVLIAWARHDFINQLKRSGLAFKLIRDHRLELFEGGHAAFLEDPDRFEQTLRKFLESISEGSGPVFGE